MPETVRQETCRNYKILFKICNMSVEKLKEKHVNIG